MEINGNIVNNRNYKIQKNLMSVTASDWKRGSIGLSEGIEGYWGKGL